MSKSDLYAQCGSIPQSCINEYPIYTCIGSNTPFPTATILPGLPGLNMPNGSVYFVSGKFTFDHSYGLSNCTFVMEANAEIEIGVPVQKGNQVAFFSSLIKGCNGLWKQLTVNPSNNFSFSGSKMEDSLNGIRTNPGASFSGRRSIYEDNYKSFSNFGTPITVNNIIAISESTFRSSGSPLLPGVPPGANKWPSAGIILNGNHPGFLVAGCYFHNIQNGISLVRCNMSGIASNNVFRNIRSQYTTPNPNFGNGILHQGSGINVTLNYSGLTSGSYIVGAWNTPYSPATQSAFNFNFESCDRGVRVVQAQTKLRNCQMLDCNFGVVITQCTNGNLSTVEKNNIRLPRIIGIDINGNFPNFSSIVHDNTISINSSPTAVVGIRHIATNSSTQAVKFTKNRILMGAAIGTPSQIANVGIELSGVAGSQVYDLNDVTISANTINYRGILLRNNADNCYVEDNTIQGVTPPNNILIKERIGILANEVELSVLRCNRMSGLGRCLNIVAECWSSIIANNNFISGVNGLVYGSDQFYGLSDNQFGTGNRWRIPTGFLGAQARSISTTNLSFNNSLYRIHENDTPVNSEFWPSPIDIPISFNTWFAVDNTLPFPSGGCQTGFVVPNGGGISNSVLDVINSNFGNWPNDAYLYWHSDWHVYNVMELNPGFVSTSAAAQNFLASKASTPAWKLWNNRLALQQTGILNPSATNNLNTLIDQQYIMEQSITTMVEQYAVNPSDSVLRNAITTQIASYELVCNNVDSIWAPFITSIATQANNLQTLLSAVNVSTVFDTHLKYTMNIDLKRILNPSYLLTPSEETQLIWLAEQCHRIEGAGVLDARNILNMYGIPCVQEDPESCSGQILPRATDEGTSNLAISEVSIYPNPGKEQLNVNLNNALGALVKLELVNSIGVIVHSEKTSNSMLQINTGSFTQGIYTVRITRDGSKEQILRWMKLE